VNDLIQTASAPGKIILLGEHGVVYGNPAIAAPICLRATVSIAESKSRKVISLPRGTTPTQRNAFGISFQAALKHMSTLGIALPSLDVSVTSEIPLSMGLGSSGAISVATARALWMMAGTKNPSVSKVEATALEMEKCFHGTPSGIDHSTSSRNSIIYFKTGNVKPIHIKHDFQFVIVLMGKRPGTKETVSQLRERQSKYPQRNQAVFKLIAQLAQEGKEALEMGDAVAFGNIMDMNHGCLSALGLSGPRIDSAVHAMRAAGASGAKLTGAGGDGGAVIGLFPNATQAVKKLNVKGFNCFASVVSATRNGDSE
jgi:mevalonate kinase